jgi:hypothetical protein
MASEAYFNRERARVSALLDHCVDDALRDVDHDFDCTDSDRSRERPTAV